MFLNVSNHASNSWSKKQLEQAHVYGEVVDVPFPNVDPQATTRDVMDLAMTLYKGLELPVQDEPVYAMVQGEMSLTFALVSLLEGHGVTCVVACSERKTVEAVQEDGTVRKTSVFDFVQFRRYQ